MKTTIEPRATLIVASTCLAAVFRRSNSIMERRRCAEADYGHAERRTGYLKAIWIKAEP